MEKKPMFISDTVHGAIPVSYLEKQIISTQAFNRLHNVLQNSTVYLTYPSNRTSRFSHSLGAMHLAGKMFYFSLTNCSLNTREEFFRLINAKIEDIKNQQDFIRKMNRELKNFVKIVDKIGSIYIEDALYDANTPQNIMAGNVFAYLVLYQAIRCTALLHDVGHLPFSHVTEHALKDIKELLSTGSGFNPAKAREFYDTFSYHGALHEGIGKKIGIRLIEDTIDNIKAVNNEAEAKNLVFHEFVLKFVELLFQAKEDDTSVFYCIYSSLISGAIDCDRLDSVVRDAKGSGFSGSNRIDYERLIPAMKMFLDGNKPKFCASMSTLSTVEELFNQRWLFYRYVNYHHRVIKTNYLLRSIIVTLSKYYLESDIVSSDSDSQVLPLNISGLWKGIRKEYSAQVFFDGLIQWDDAWLLSVLRYEYFTNYRESEKDSLLTCQLEELLSNRKNYRSLIKRSDDFWLIDQSLVQNLDFDWAQERPESLNTYFNNALQHNKSMEDLFSSHGYFLRTIMMIFSAVQGINMLQGLIRKTIENTACQYDIIDLVVAFETPMTGLENTQCLLYNRNDEVLKFENVSRVYHYLQDGPKFFPPFFLYVKEKKDKPLNKDAVNQFLKEIGKNIAEQLPVLLNEIINGIKKVTES